MIQIYLLVKSRTGEMKILLLAPHPFFQHRGTAIAVKLLLEILAEQGHLVEVLTYHEGEDVEIQNVRIQRILALPWVRNIRPGPSWEKIVCDVAMFWKCLKLTRKTRYDLIHAVEESVFMAMAVKALFRIPFVYDMDSSLVQQLTDKYGMLKPIKWLLRLFERNAVRSSLGIVAVCKSLQDIALTYDPEKLTVRLEDISLLESGAQKGELLHEMLGTKGPFVMYVGNLEKYQGIDLLLEGFQLAVVKCPELHLVIIGGDEKHIQRYKDYSRKLNIKEKTHLIGPKPLSQLAFYLNQADILVSPRLQGHNTPMKIYSYLDSGKPIIATRLPTHTQVLDDQIALLVSPRPQNLADGLVTILEDYKLRSDLAMCAKTRVQSEFSYKAFQRKLLRFYESLHTELTLLK